MDDLRTDLRQVHGVRVVEPREEGSAAEHLPPGVYGFSGSPALAAPLFAERRYRNFEVHRVAEEHGGVLIIGFVTPSEKASLATAPEAVDIMLFPDAEGAAKEIVAVALPRIVHHREYLVRNTAGIALRVLPSGALTV